MINSEYFYILINLGSIAVPLLLSFDKHVQFYKNWKYLFPAIFIVAAFFIIWDIIFTSIGIWSFNNTYHSSIVIYGLPLGEWLFFICIPYACMFIYESLNTHIKKDFLKGNEKIITYILAFISLGMVVLYSNRYYTFTTFSFLLLWQIIHYLIFGFKFLSRFYLAYIVSLLPFWLVNGLLTSIPIVLYNNHENMGIRLGSIPVEDHFYGLLMVMMVMTLYEYFKKNTKTL